MPRKKIQLDDGDWLAVERHMRKSLRGQRLDEIEMALITKAYESDGKRYKTLHDRIRDEEIKREKERYG